MARENTLSNGKSIGVTLSNLNVFFSGWEHADSEHDFEDLDKLEEMFLLAVEVLQQEQSLAPVVWEILRIPSETQRGISLDKLFKYADELGEPNSDQTIIDILAMLGSTFAEDTSEPDYDEFDDERRDRIREQRHGDFDDGVPRESYS